MESEALDIYLYKEALIVLGAAAVVIPLFHRLRVSPVLGFILIGVVVGPFGLAQLTPVVPWISAVTISSADSITPIARLGVVLLLFMIGLELSAERLWLMRRLVFGLGFLQVSLCALVLAGVAILAKQSYGSAIIIGFVMTMSSTAVVLQVLSERKEVHRPFGRASFAILLFQDLAVVPLLFALTALAPGSDTDSLAGLGYAAIRAVTAVVLIVGVGRLVLRPLFRSVARTHSSDLFVAACLLVVIATGLAASSAGLSMAVGALVGGLLLAGTEYRRQVEVTIDPFKGLFIGVFLISVGMGLHLPTLVAHPLMVAVAVVGLITLKALVIVPLGRLFGMSWRHGLRMGLLLGPGGEFAFVTMGLAEADGFLDAQTSEVLLFATALTMAAIPLLSKLGQALAPRQVADIEASLRIPQVSDALPRVIIAGFGRVGQTVATMLAVHKVPYVAIDNDPDRVAQERGRGKPVYYGDMTQVDLLRHLHLDTARALVVTLDDPPIAEALVAAARSERSDLMIVARARDARHAAQLYRAGVSDAVPETIEASLQLSEAVLVDVGVPMGPVIATIHEQRASLQSEIKAMAPNAVVRLLGRNRLRDRVRPTT
ncbi:cation:proton antiporter [Rhodopila sp.]|uniref:cation:proton antiporter domain-containing protein n=1 Tax=Rhodopila sp. TaxID=2480087 RepID=UPI002C8A7755|nr:cation:proton antiporter [Rhodopila sp.]HVZ07389.1 cation:proton antiporter [Rhodopila sp.]